MNKIYNVIWSYVKNAYVVTSELCSKVKHRKSVVKIGLALGLFALSSFNFSQAKVEKLGSVLLIGDNLIHGGKDVPPAKILGQDTAVIAIGEGSKAGLANSDEVTTAIAIGAQAEAIGLRTLAVGRLAKATGTYASAFGVMAEANANRALAAGSEASATGNFSVAIGNKSKAENEYAVAFGSNAQAIGVRSTAIGNNTRSYERSIALGNSTYAESVRSIAIGNIVKANGNNTIGIGNVVETNSAYSIVIGDRAQSTTKAISAIALGNNVNVSGRSSVAIGGASESDTGPNINAAKTTGFAAVALGGGTEATDSAVAIGRSATATAESAIGLGMNALASKQNGIAIGSGTMVTGEQSIALGKGATVANKNSIAMRAGATTTRDNEVSIGGSTSGTAYLSNVTRGVLSTDASNMSQLRNITSALGGGAQLSAEDGSWQQPNFAPAIRASNPIHNVYDALQHVVTTGITFNGDIGGEIVAIGDTLKVTGGKSTDLTENNIGITIAKGDTDTSGKSHHTLDIQLAKDLNLSETGSITIGNTLINNEGVEVGKILLTENGLVAGDIQVTTDGVNAGNKKINNVAAGAEETDAVNFGQLSALHEIVDQGFTIAGDTGENNVQLGDKITLQGGATTLSQNDNIGIEVDESGVINFKLANEIDIDALKVGESGVLLNQEGLQIGTDGPKINTLGIDGGGQSIVNIADGKIAEQSQEAITGGQFYTINQNLAQLMGGKATYENGILTAIDFSEGFKTLPGAQEVNTVTDGFNVINQWITQGLTVSADNQQDQNLQLGDQFNIIGGAALETLTDHNIGVQLIAPDKATDQPLTFEIKLAKDLQLTDGSILFSDNGAKLDNTGLSFVGIEKSPSITATGVDAGQQKITNVAPGTEEGDAVNYGQIQKIQTELAGDLLSFTGDQGRYNFKLGSTVAINGGETDSQKLATGHNIGVIVDEETGNIALKLAKNLDLGSDGSLNISPRITVDQDGLKIASGPSITTTGIDAGGQKITHLQAGDLSKADSTDAVTGGQIYTLEEHYQKALGANTMTLNEGALVTVDFADNFKEGGLTNTGVISSVGEGFKVTAKNIKLNRDVAINLATVLGAGASLNDAGILVKPNYQTSLEMIGAEHAINDIGSGFTFIGNKIAEGITFSGDSGSKNRQLGDTIIIKGDSNDKALTSGNIGVVVDETTGNIDLKLAEKLNLGATGSILLGDTQLNNAGLMLSDTLNITQESGIKAGNQRITHVAKGSEDQDAVNLAQLKDITAIIGGNITIDAEGNIEAPIYTVGGNESKTIDGALTNIDQSITNLVKGGLSFTGDNQGADGEPVTAKIELGEHLNISGGASLDTLTENNIGVVVKDNQLDIQLSKDLDLTPEGSLILGSTLLNQAGLKLSDTLSITNENGIQAGHKQITHLAAGSVAKDSTEAITGGQAYDINQYISQALMGSKGQLKEDGTLENLNFATALGNPEGTTTVIDNVYDALQDHTKHITDLSNKIIQGESGKLGLVILGEGNSQGSIIIDNELADHAEIFDISNQIDNRKLTGVGKGEIKDSSIDAINGSQLYDANRYLSSVLMGDKAELGDDGRLTNLNFAGALNLEDEGKKVNNVYDALQEHSSQLSHLTDKVVSGEAGRLGLIVLNDKKDQIIVDNELAKKATVVNIANNSTNDQVNARTLTGVAKGAVNPDSFDAINGSQLYNANLNIANILGGGAEVDEEGNIKAPTYKIGESESTTLDGALTNIDQSITNLVEGGLSFTGDNQGDDGEPITAKIQLGESLNIHGGAPTDALTENNIGVVVKDNQLNIQLSNNLNLTEAGSFKFGEGTRLTNEGLTIADGPSIKQSGIDAANTKISNVEAGAISADSTDAITGGQLYDGNDSIATILGGGVTINDDGTLNAPTYSFNNGTYTAQNVGDALTHIDQRIIDQGETLNSGITFKGDKGLQNFKLGSEIMLQGHAEDKLLTDGNIGVMIDKAGDINVQLAQNIDLTGQGSLKIGETATLDHTGFVITNGPSITASGIDAGGKKITNLLKGDTSSADSTDAITGGQLYELEEHYQKIIGAKKMVSQDGTLFEVDFKENFKEGGLNTGSIPSVGKGFEVIAQNIQTNQTISENIATALGGGAKVTDDGYWYAPNYQEALTKVGADSPVNSVESGFKLIGDKINEGLNFKGDGAKVQNFKLGKQVSILGGANEESLTTNNIGINIDNNGAIKVQLAKDLLLTDGSILFNDDQQGMRLENLGLSFGTANSPTITASGIDAGQQKISNLQAGTEPTDAVNLSQLQTVEGTVSGGLSFKGDNNSSKKFNLGETVALHGGATAELLTNNNIGINIDNSGVIQVQLAKNLDLSTDGSIIFSDQGATLNSQGLTFIGVDNTPSITTSGIDAGQQKITNVSSGTAKQDAVNVSQLEGVLAVLGGDATLNEDGSVKAPTYQIGDKTHHNLGDTISNINENIYNLGQGTTGLIKLSEDKKLISIDNKLAQEAIKLDFSNEIEGDRVARQLTGIANGEIAKNSVDAINGGQLYTTHQYISNLLMGDQAVLNADGTLSKIDFAGAIGSESEKPIDNIYQAFETLTKNGLKFQGDEGDTTIQLGENATIVGGATSTLTENNIGVLVDETGNINIQLAKDLQLPEGSIQFSDDQNAVRLDSSGLMIQENLGMTTHNGIMAGDQKITHLQAGTNDQDAVNISQLKGVLAGLGGDASINEDGSIKAPEYKVGDTTYNSISEVITTIDNSINNLGQGTSGLVKLHETDSGVQITIDNNLAGKDSVVNLSYFTEGSDSIPRKLTGVASGKLSNLSVDAVNGEQLYMANVNTAKALGGSTKLDEQGQLSAVNFKDAIGSDEDITSVYDAFKKINHNVDGGLTFIGDDQSSKNFKLGEKVKIEGGIDDPSQLVEDQIGVNIDQETGAIRIGLAKDLSLTDGSVAFSDAGAKLDNSGLSFIGLENAPSIKATGIDAGMQKIVNVISGIEDLDAVNISQLKGVLAGLGGGADINADGSIKAPEYQIGDKTYHNLGDTISNIDENIHNLRQGTTGLVKLSEDNTLILIDNNLAELADTVDLSNEIEGKKIARKLTGIDDGTIVKNSLDAVNGGQLYKINEFISKALMGSHGELNDDGTLKELDFAGALSLSQSPHKITSVYDAFKDHTDRINKLTNKVVGGEHQLGLIVLSEDGESIVVDNELADHAGTLDIANVMPSGAKVNRTLTGVEKGKRDNDAVNLSQLKDITTVLGGGAKIDENGKLKAPSYTFNDGSKHTNVGSALNNLDDRVTNIDQKVVGIASGTEGLVKLGKDEQGQETLVIDNQLASTANKLDISNKDQERTLTGVKAGQIHETSTDAINGQQIYMVNKSIAEMFGGGATIDQDGFISTPEYIIGDRKFNNVGDSIKYLASSLDNGSVGVFQLDREKNQIIIADNDHIDNETVVNIGNRKIVGVANGKVEKGSQEVVNGGQLWEVEQKIVGQNTQINHINKTLDHYNTRITNLEKTVYENRKRASAGTASAMAMSSIPYVEYSKFSFGMGVGYYDSESAISIGIQGKITDRSRYRLQMSYDTQNKVGLGAGFAFEL